MNTYVDYLSSWQGIDDTSRSSSKAMKQTVEISYYYNKETVTVKYW